MLEFETKVKDRITGFAGTVVGRIEYINGCIQDLVKPRMKKGSQEPIDILPPQRGPPWLLDMDQGLID